MRKKLEKKLKKVEQHKHAEEEEQNEIFQAMMGDINKLNDDNNP